MDEKYWKWGFFSSMGLLILAIVLILLYLVLPPLFSIIAGSDNVCIVGIQPSDNVKLGSAINDLCNSSRTFLAIGSMILIILSAVIFAFVLPVIATIEVSSSSRFSILRKILWIAVFWFLLGVGGVAAYYFIDRKNAI